MIPISEEQYLVAAGQSINISSSRLLFEASWYVGDKWITFSEKYSDIILSDKYHLSLLIGLFLI